VQLGVVIVPIAGTTGTEGCALTIIFADGGELHPSVFVTVYVYVPAGNPDIVAVVLVPEVVTLPGKRVRVHVPAEGSPLKATLPVDRLHVGCVINPTTGAEGFMQAQAT
jgi:hypothetical protein